MGDLVVKFRGADYRVPAHKIFPLAEKIEDIATLTEIAGWGAAPKMVKMARCFGCILRYAGAEVSDQDVHSEMMAQIKKGGRDGADMVAAQAMAALVAILMDGAPEADGTDAGGKLNAS